MRNGWAWGIAVTVLGGWTAAMLLLGLALTNMGFLAPRTDAQHGRFLLGFLGAQAVAVAAPAAAAWMAARQGWRPVAWTFGGIAAGFAAVIGGWYLLNAIVQP
ncbi:hypothetical protein ABZS66_48230 [Dactylosporangium sp. NPDC005572]|uniref:hypothetical protein n=1 Tax=Dactylosporangium sp. NPDC005572 TaxID=3156889 RepID=UPI0033A6B3BD